MIGIFVSFIKSDNGTPDAVSVPPAIGIWMQELLLREKESRFPARKKLWLLYFDF